MFGKPQNKKDEEEQDKNTREADISPEEFLELKKVRTLEDDEKEYKKKTEEFGDDIPFYDPYLIVKEENKAQLKPQIQIPTAPSVAAPTKPKEKKEQKQEMTKKEFIPQKISSVADRMKEEKEPEQKEEKGKDEKKNDRHNIPFKELMDLKKIQALEKEEQEYRRIKERHGEHLKPNIKPVSVAPRPAPIKPLKEIVQKTPQTQVPEEQKDEETVIREKIAQLLKEHRELEQKIEDFQNELRNISSEWDSLAAKKEEVEKILNPIIEEEKNIENEIKNIEREEEKILAEDKRREKEKERWAKEDQRQSLEKKKWLHMEDLDEVLKAVKEKDDTYKALRIKKEEAKKALAGLEREKYKKEIELRLPSMRKLKKDIESNKTRLATQIRTVEDSTERLSKSEREIILEKNNIESREQQAKDFNEQKVMETKRWEIESRLRKVEQERWQIEDRHKELLEMMVDITDQYNKILRQEREAENSLKATVQER